MQEYAEDISPELLRLLAGLRAAPERDPRTAAAAKTRFLLEAYRIGQTPPARHGVRGWLRWASSALPVLSGRTAGTVAAAACVLVVAVVSSHQASRALPGDALYPLKTTAESLQLMVYGHGAAGADLRLRLAERRLSEITRLADLGRTDDLAVAVAGYSVQVDAATRVLQAPGGDVTERQAAALAEEASAMLSRNEVVLSAVAQQVPAEAASSLEQARSVTAAGVAAANDVLDGRRGGGSAATATLPAGLAGDTATPTTAGRQGTRGPDAATATAVPTATAGVEATATPGSTHGKPTATPVGSVATSTMAPTATPLSPTDTPAATATRGKSGEAPGQQTATATPVPPTSTPEPTATERNTPPGQAKKDPTPTVAAPATEPTPVPTPVPTPEPPTATPVPPPTATPEPASQPTATAEGEHGKSEEAPGHQK